MEPLHLAPVSLEGAKETLRAYQVYQRGLADAPAELIFDESGENQEHLAYFLSIRHRIGLSIPRLTFKNPDHVHSSDGVEARFLRKETRKNLKWKPRNKKPKPISICIPHRNRSDLVCALLKELKNQSVLPGEVVLVDDGSEPQHLEKVRKASFESHPFPVKLIATTFSGARVARNRAAREASCELIFFLDDDNLPYSGLCEELGKAHAASGYPILVPVVEKVREGENHPPVLWVPTGPCMELAAVHNHIGDMNCLIEKSIFEGLGGLRDDHNLACEDWEFLVRAHHHGIEIGVYPTPVFRYLDHPDGFLKRAPRVLSEVSVFSAFKNSRQTVMSSVWSEYRKAEIERTAATHIR